MSVSAVGRLAGENEAHTHAQVNMLHSSHARIDGSTHKKQKKIYVYFWLSHNYSSL